MAMQANVPLPEPCWRTSAKPSPRVACPLFWPATSNFSLGEHPSRVHQLAGLFPELDEYREGLSLPLVLILLMTLLTLLVCGMTLRVFPHHLRLVVASGLLCHTRTPDADDILRALPAFAFEAFAQALSCDQQWRCAASFASAALTDCNVDFSVGHFRWEPSQQVRVADMAVQGCETLDLRRLKHLQRRSLMPRCVAVMTFCILPFVAVSGISIPIFRLAVVHSLPMMGRNLCSSALLRVSGARALSLSKPGGVVLRAPRSMD